MSDLSLAVEKLRSLSPKLNSAVTEADGVVRVVERFLVQECGLGVEAEVPLHYNDKGKPVSLLRYASVNGEFRIAVTNTDGSTHFVTRAWTECERNQRLVSFSALPKLLIAIAKAVEQQIASTTSTANTVGQILNALGTSAWARNGNSKSDADADPNLTLLMSNPAEPDPDAKPAPAPAAAPAPSAPAPAAPMSKVSRMNVILAKT